MRIKNPLRVKMESLKVRGNPVLIKTAKERLDAHYWKKVLGIKIKTKTVINGNGWEIHRVA